MISMLGAYSLMNGRNPECQRLPRYCSKPGSTHPLGKVFLHGKIRDRTWKIAVCGRVPADETTDQRQHLMKVKVIQPANRSESRGGELQDDEAAPRLEDSVHLTQSRIEAGNIPDSKGYNRTINRCIGKRKVESVCSNGIDRPVPCLFNSCPEHRLGEISADYTPPEIFPPCHLAGYIERTCA